MPRARADETTTTAVSLGRDILDPLPGESDADPIASFQAVSGEASLVDGRYRLEREMGRGGMGVVHRALDVTLERMVALKLVHPEMTARPEIVELFRQEARALAAIRSEHIVAIYAFGLHAGSFFFSMELVDGESLEALIRDHRAAKQPVPLHRALVILRQIASGLDEVHRRGLIHRDVKPDNVMIERRTGRPVLIDFGLAVEAASDGGRFRGAGTPGYLAPELARGEVPSARADVYSFAVTAFELLTGRSPFVDAEPSELIRRHATIEAPPLSSFRPDLVAADAVMAAALAKRPGDRPPSCGAFAASLAEALLGFSTVERRFSSVPPPPASTRSTPPPSSTTTHALVVDDDADFARLAARAVGIAFHGKPIKVLVAHDGARGLELAAQRVPRLLLLDFDMPQMNGLEMLSRLRALPGASTCRVMVISAAGARLPRHSFQLLGVEDVLPKPVAFPALLEALQQVAKRDALDVGAAPARTRRSGPT